jgi:heme exporter protein C
MKTVKKGTRNIMLFDFYANPHRFEKIARFLMPFLCVGGLAVLSLGLYIGLFASPPDYQQKETVRIMYIHVPTAWLSMGIFCMMGILSTVFLVRKHQIAYLIAKSAAPIGAVLSLICLITGSLWGRPTWGTYWIWDARLTSMLILFFMYLGYILLNHIIDDTHKAGKITSIFAIVGLIDLPIIKFSVEWWNTLHQGASVIRSGGSTIHESMLTPLLLSALGIALLVAGLVFMGTLTALMQLKIKRYYYKKVSHYG